MEFAVLIPAYEADGHLVDTVRSLLALGAGDIVVVDDGSSEKCGVFFSEAEALGARICRHGVNRGKGAAIKTGIRYILDTFPDCRAVVTADADGQHAAADILRVAGLALENPDSLVLGTREFGGENVPWKSRAGNRITSAVFKLITGRSCPDTQTGLRGLPRSLLPLALQSEGDRYEYEMNMLMDFAERKIPFLCEPIETIYLDDNRASHFRVVRDSYLVYRRPVTFALAAGASTLVDLGAFWLLERLLGEGELRVFAAGVTARLISGGLNFYLNKKVTFRSHGDTKKESLRYLVLFLSVMLISGGTVAVLSRLPVPTVLIKIVVDCILFAANYVIERKWVFRRED